jgi:hypothetical protein
MPNNLLNTTNDLLSGKIPPVIWTILFTVVFVYIIIYGFLQVRQLKVLQDKVSTPGDKWITLTAYLYLLIQVLLFVVTLLIL